MYFLEFLFLEELEGLSKSLIHIIDDTTEPANFLCTHYMQFSFDHLQSHWYVLFQHCDYCMMLRFPSSYVGHAINATPRALHASWNSVWQHGLPFAGVRWSSCPWCRPDPSARRARWPSGSCLGSRPTRPGSSSRSSCSSPLVCSGVHQPEIYFRNEICFKH